MKGEAERREWEEEEDAAGLLAPQRRRESREEGPCERSREEEEEAEARRRRAGEATIISFDIDDLGGIRQGRGGLMICPCWGETSSRACAGRNPTGGSGSAGLLRLDEKRREMMQMADADRRE